VALSEPGAVDIVIPTIGRPSLDVLLDALARQAHDLPARIVLVDDRPGGEANESLAERIPQPLSARTTVVVAGGRGPAAARNRGWRTGSARWVSFLDDDVVPGVGWARQLAHDLATVPAEIGAVQGRIVVPLPADRRPTDRERNVSRLASASWITADLAVRRDVLDATTGFDERFVRAYREDTDFQLRAEAAGHGFAHGERTTFHPVGPAPWWVSVTAQRGNADDALLRALHGPDALGHGRRRRHLAITACAAAAAAAAVTGRRRIAAVAAAGWLVGTAELAWARIRPGPHHIGEIAAMVATSVAIPPTATAHWIAGRWRWRDGGRGGGPIR
jgi:Glycosyl transferase family 2